MNIVKKIGKTKSSMALYIFTAALLIAAVIVISIIIIGIGIVIMGHYAHGNNSWVNSPDASTDAAPNTNNITIIMGGGIFNFTLSNILPGTYQVRCPIIADMIDNNNLSATVRPIGICYI